MNPVQIIAMLMAFIGVTNAEHHGVYAGDYYAYPKYSYSYGVKDALTGDAKSAHETRDGGVVKGSYSLVQPDGVLRTVNYVADPIHGFQAQVINSNPGIHAVAPVVKKAVIPAVAPVAYHGYGHHGHHGYAPVVAKAPVAVGHAHHGYGHHGLHHAYGGHVGHVGHLGHHGHLGIHGGHGYGHGFAGHY